MAPISLIHLNNNENILIKLSLEEINKIINQTHECMMPYEFIRLMKSKHEGILSLLKEDLETCHPFNFTFLEVGTVSVMPHQIAYFTYSGEQIILDFPKNRTSAEFKRVVNEKRKGPVAMIKLFDGNKYFVSIEKDELTSIYKNRSSSGLMNTTEMHQNVESMIRAYREVKADGF
jgi:hypothetical protein